MEIFLAESVLNDDFMVGLLTITRGGQPRGVEYELRSQLARAYHADTGNMPEYEIGRTDLVLTTHDDKPDEYVEIKMYAPLKNYRNTFLNDFQKLFNIHPPRLRTFVYFGLYGNTQPPTSESFNEPARRAEINCEKRMLKGWFDQSVANICGGIAPEPSEGYVERLVRGPSQGASRLLYAWWITWS